MQRNAKGQFLPEKAQSVLKGIRADNFKLLKLPVGFETAVTTLIKRLPRP